MYTCSTEGSSHTSVVVVDGVVPRFTQVVTISSSNSPGARVLIIIVTFYHHHHVFFVVYGAVPRFIQVIIKMFRGWLGAFQLLSRVSPCSAIVIFWLILPPYFAMLLSISLLIQSYNLLFLRFLICFGPTLWLYINAQICLNPTYFAL